MKVELLNLLVAAQVRELAKEIRSAEALKVLPGTDRTAHESRKQRVNAQNLDDFIPAAYDELERTMSMVLTHISQRSTPEAGTPSPPATP